MRTVGADEVHRTLAGGEGEIAFLDVREPGQYGEGHPLFAVNLPYSELEIRVGELVPNRTVPVVIIDDGARSSDGEGVGALAARRLAALGYEDVARVERGARGWHSAGLNLFEGVNVPSKALGELVEHALGTPHIDASALAARQAAGDDLLLVDGRTGDEFRSLSIPGARSCPNAELPLRVPDWIPGSGTTIVVNCAGRTRSIIGAENLRALGLPNPVLALENGTQGWRLSGLEPARDVVPEKLGALSASARQRSRESGRKLLERFEIPTVDMAEVERWRPDGRTVYLIDVRTDLEYEAGHFPGARHAPGGQLAQATDRWIGVRGACIVLLDDSLVRAAATARWLRAMGHDARVGEADSTAFTESGAASAAPLASGPVPLPSLDPSVLPAGAGVLDLSPSAAYRECHIEGALWGIRPRLRTLPGLRQRPWVVVAPRAATAALAALDLVEAGARVAGYLPRDPAGWATAGLGTVSTPGEPPDGERIDFLFFVHDRHQGNPEASRAYLAWETGLVSALSVEERRMFRVR